MKTAAENLDIVRYARRHFIMDFEIAEAMQISVEDYRRLLSEPLTKQEKSDIAAIVKSIFRIQYLERRDEFYVSSYEYQTRKYSEWISAHNGLRDGPKYTGQNRSWDSYNGCFNMD